MAPLSQEKEPPANSGRFTIAQVRRFDLAFEIPGGGRLLVEVVTPAPQSADTWVEEKRGEFTIVSGDASSKDAALLRLTSSFAEKARVISEAMGKGYAGAGDYKVIAISGLRISQEAKISVSATGNPPEFAKAFLPIGPMFTRATMRHGGTGITWSPFEYRFSDRIAKASGRTVDRNAFVSGQYDYIDAVAYSEVGLSGLSDAHHQVSVLHNPTSSFSARPLMLKMGREYTGEIDGEQLHLQPHRLPEIAAEEDAMEAADQAAFDRLFSDDSGRG